MNSIMNHWIPAVILVSALASLFIARFIHVSKGPEIPWGIERKRRAWGNTGVPRFKSVLGREGEAVEPHAVEPHSGSLARQILDRRGDQHEAYLHGLERPSQETVRAVAKRYLDRLERERGGERGGEDELERERRTR